MYYLMDPDTDICQTEQSQMSYLVDFIAEQSSAVCVIRSLICACIGAGGYQVGRAASVSIRSLLHTLIAPAAANTQLYIIGSHISLGKNR